MANPVSVGRLVEIFRYYQAGIINALFGYGAFAALLALKLDVYLAQLISHLLGMTFNYFTYSRHVFRDSGPAKTRFVASYAVNYAVSLGGLAIANQYIKSPYLSGLAVLVIVSILNYFVLKHLVFRPQP
jgi:putative flippase GtrA